MKRVSEIELMILAGVVAFVCWMVTGFVPLLVVSSFAIGAGVILAFLSWQTRREREAAERRERIG